MEVIEVMVNIDAERASLFESKFACMFRLEGVGGTKARHLTLASTDRGRHRPTPSPNAPIRNASARTDDSDKPAQR